MAPLLGYWNIRGLATPIRLLLEIAGVEYEEKLYVCGPPPDFAREAWLKDKAELEVDFPNLPYYLDGDVKLTQSHVIMRYLARKHKLEGDSEEARVKADLLAAQVMDYHMDYVRTIAYNPEHAKEKESYDANVRDRLKALSAFVGDKKFAVGNSVTYADLVLYEYLEGQTYYNADTLKDFPVLQQFVASVNELEPVKKYFAKPDAIKAPFNGGPAFVGGPYSDVLAKK